MKIYLPHIKYTVHVRRFTKPHPELPNSHAYTTRVNQHSCAVYIKKGAKPPIIAHELVHVLRFICQDRDMSFINEEEHMAYIMQLLMGRILGFEYY